MLLSVENVSCGYMKGRPVLEGISFDVADGQVVCVLGPNGCGKTTLFKTVLGVMPALAGRVTIDGEDLSTWTTQRMADTMAYVSQSHTPPFPYLVKDVVMLGRTNRIGYMGTPKSHDVNVVNEAMESMGIYDMRERPYTGLSGGELQLVMIARAIAQEPRVLVLDEPTAALDYGNAMKVISKVRQLAAQGFAVIMTTHSPDHAFMTKAQVALLNPDRTMLFGPVNDVVTEASMKVAYGVGVKIIEFNNAQGEVMRLCAPVV